MLFAIGVLQALLQGFDDMSRFFVVKVPVVCLFYSFCALLVLFLVFVEKSFAAPPGQGLAELVELDVGRSFPSHAGFVDLSYEPSSDRSGQFIELGATITAQSEPVAGDQADEKGQQGGKLGTEDYGMLDFIKDHGLVLCLWFLAGLMCGGAFGWPPFSETRRRK